jgi:hypothetical protein
LAHRSPTSIIDSKLKGPVTNVTTTIRRAECDGGRGR